MERARGGLGRPGVGGGEAGAAGSGPGMAMAPGAMSSKLELASNGGHGGFCKEEEEA